MKIVIFGLSITSSWGNGHATTYRALLCALKGRGHRIVFFERDQEWYASNRDMPEPPFCDVRIYDDWKDATSSIRRELAEADIAIVGSYFPDALPAIQEVFDSPTETKAFYDIDTPITVAKLRAGDNEYLTPDLVSGFDIYFSFTGGPLLSILRSEFGAQKAVPLYCSFDADKHRFCAIQSDYSSDLSYMGTYAPDRQDKLEKLFCAVAWQFPTKKFLLAGPQYPAELHWPPNLRRITHLEPRFHPAFYSSSKFTLNLTRGKMAEAGYSPSVRLFEAAGYGATIVSDKWGGLETFFTPGDEILVADSADQVASYLRDMSDTEIREIGQRAQQRVFAEHSSQHRAVEFEEYVVSCSRTKTPA